MKNNTIKKLSSEIIVDEVTKARDQLREIQTTVEAYSKNYKRPGLVKKYKRADELLRQLIVSMK